MGHWNRCIGAALLLCAWAGTQAAPGAESARTITRGTAHDALYDIAFDGGDGIAVGDFGNVLASIDGGLSWTHVWTGPGGMALFGAARRAGHCVAVGQQGALARAADCRSWSAVPPVTGARLMAVSMNRSGLAYAVGAFGQVVMSGDWGRSWTPVAIDWHRITDDGAEPHLYAVDVRDDGSVTIAGEFELILRLRAGSWQVLRKGKDALFGLTLRDDGIGYAVGQSGTVLATADGGTTWRALDSGVSSILTGVAATPDGLVVATGVNTIVASRDQGRTWRVVQSPQIRGAWHQAVAASEYAPGKRRLVTVGAAGLMLELNN